MSVTEQKPNRSIVYHIGSVDGLLEKGLTGATGNWPARCEPGGQTVDWLAEQQREIAKNYLVNPLTVCILNVIKLDEAG